MVLVPRSDVDRLGLGAAKPLRHQHPGEQHGGEHAGRDADQQHDREPLHRAGPEHEHDDARNGMGHVRLEDGAARFLVAQFHRLDDVAPASPLLADALVDEHVGVDRRADRQHEAGDAGQGQRAVDERQDAQDHEHVDDDGEVRIDAEAAVGDEHERHHQRHRHAAGEDAGADRIGAEVGADGRFLDDLQLIERQILDLVIHESEAELKKHFKKLQLHRMF